MFPDPQMRQSFVWLTGSLSRSLALCRLRGSQPWQGRYRDRPHEVASGKTLGGTRKHVYGRILRSRHNMDFIYRRILNLQYLLPGDK